MKKIGLFLVLLIVGLFLVSCSPVKTDNSDLQDLSDADLEKVAAVGEQQAGIAGQAMKIPDAAKQRAYEASRILNSRYTTRVPPGTDNVPNFVTIDGVIYTVGNLNSFCIETDGKVEGSTGNPLVAGKIAIPSMPRGGPGETCNIVNIISGGMMKVDSCTTEIVNASAQNPAVRTNGCSVLESYCTGAGSDYRLENLYCKKGCVSGACY